jgi:hypothetical protein
MTLIEFKQHIESFPKDYTFNYSISIPFSWRGVYAEVAFAIYKESSTREEVLEYIEIAYNETFSGYKGGEYKYYDYTDIHFEESTKNWTDGRYALKWIDFITEMPNPQEFEDLEETLVKLAFE